MGMSPPQNAAPSNGVRSAWAPPPPQPVVEPLAAPPALLLPAHLVVDPASLAAVAEHVKATIAQAVREGVAEGFTSAWPEDQPTPVPPEPPAAG